MGDIERAFRHELEVRALVEDWKGWNTARLVYADWLAEHRPEEEAITRAPWEWLGATRRKDGPLERWRVVLPRPFTALDLHAHRLGRMLQGCVNGMPVLHFPVATLKVQHPAEVHGVWGPAVLVGVLHFTFQARRKSFSWLDLGAHRLGFKALFCDNPGVY